MSLKSRINKLYKKHNNIATVADILSMPYSTVYTFIKKKYRPKTRRRKYKK